MSLSYVTCRGILAFGGERISTLPQLRLTTAQQADPANTEGEIWLPRPPRGTAFRLGQGQSRRPGQRRNHMHTVTTAISSRHARGFTLAELAIVLLIVAILAAALIVLLSGREGKPPPPRNGSLAAGDP